MAITPRAIVLCALLCFSASLAKEQVASLKNVDVKRTIDLSTQVATITIDSQVENTGNSAVNSVLFAVDPIHRNRVAWVEAHEGEKEDHLKVSSVQVDGHNDAAFYRVDLASPLAAGASVTIRFVAVLTEVQEPYPAEIIQTETQKVRFTGNHLFYSPYPTETQETTVILSSSTIESNSKLNPTTVSDKEIKYGPYSNKAPFSVDELSVHFENNGPFLKTVDVVREIEVSHWGNVAVTEHFHLRNDGAKLKGSFSRFDFQRNNAAMGVAAVKTFTTHLPAQASEVYYRDIIGNISTSALQVNEDGQELEITPRFPLFGGWQTKYTVGYNLPTEAVLSVTDSGSYELKLPFVGHTYDEQVIGRLTLRVILPEGATNAVLHAPYPVDEEIRKSHATYLDLNGRPVIEAVKTNLVDQHIQDFTVTYNFQSSSLIREPLLLVGGFLVLFLTAIIYVRLDFSLSAAK